MTTIRYYIGIDGGGTKCRARLIDADGTLLGEGLGGAANIRLGLSVIWYGILEAIDAALEEARLTRDIFPQTAIGLGLAGITTAADVARTLDAGPRFGHANATSDGHAACLGAFSGGNGAILITGTGSAGYAWIDGRGHAIGGWGFEVSDEGSAAALGREAIRAALHAHDRLGPQTGFTLAVMARFGGPSDIVAFASEARPRDYGQLAPLALSYAETGDAVAVALVKRTAHDLGLYIHRLHALAGTRIALLGGMAAPLTPWLALEARTLLCAARRDAVDGAILLAKGAANGLSKPEKVLT